MILPTIATLPFAKTASPPLNLVHKLVPVRNTQARLRGRHALVPDLDLAAYRFRAVIDWIAFQMSFSRGVQVQQVQPILLRVFGRNGKIKREDPGPGDVFMRCTITMQEPQSLAWVVEAHQALVEAFGEIEPARITGIEISIDAYPKSPSDVARAPLLGAMQRTIWTDRDIWSNPNSRPRSVFGNNEKSVYKLSPGPEHDLKGEKRVAPEQHKAPALDATMFLGAKDDSVMIRVMDKVIDEQKYDGTHRVLSDDEKRARTEAALTGKELAAIGLTDIASLRRFRFVNLQKRYFQFKLPTFDVRILVTRGYDAARHFNEARKAEIYLLGGMTALMSRDQGWENKRRRFQKKMKSTLIAMGKTTTKRTVERRAPAFLSYEELNRRVVLAPQHLDKRAQTEWKRLDDRSQGCGLG